MRLEPALRSLALVAALAACGQASENDLVAPGASSPDASEVPAPDASTTGGSQPVAIGTIVSASGMTAVMVDDVEGLLLDTAVRVDSTRVGGATQAAAERALSYLGDLVIESQAPIAIEIGLAVVTDPTPHDSRTGELLVSAR